MNEQISGRTNTKKAKKVNAVQRNLSFFFFFSILSSTRSNLKLEVENQNESDDSDAGSSFMSEFMEWNYDHATWMCLARSSLPVSWGRIDCQLNGRICDYSPHDFTLKLHPISQILIKVLFSYTYLCYCENFVELWNAHLNSWMILSLVRWQSQRYFLISDYKFTYVTLQAQTSFFNTVAKVF